MKKNLSIEHEFVDFIPRDLEERKLYISIEFGTASHKCLCGCGAEVVTPISPVGWQMTYDGETVSLSPSVGSWSLPCKSHYIIKRDKVIWAGAMSDKDIEAVKRRDRRDVMRHFDGDPVNEPVEVKIVPAQKVQQTVEKNEPKPAPGLVTRILRWFGG